MATFDGRTVITLVASAAAVTRQTFGTILYATTGVSGAFGSNEIRAYANNKEAQADSDLDATTKAALALHFSQSPNAGEILVGEIDSVAGYVAAEFDGLAADATYGDFYGLVIASRVQADIEAVAAWAEANGPRLFFAQSSNADVLSATAPNELDTISGLSYERSAYLWYSDDSVAADLVWLSQFLAVDPDQQVTTASDKTLTGVDADDANVNSTEKGNVESANGNLYLTRRGVGATGKGVLASGKSIYNTWSQDWLVARIGEGVDQLFLDVSNLGRRVQFDNAGIAQVESKVRVPVLDGEEIGHLVAGESVFDFPDISDVPDADITANILRANLDVVIKQSLENFSLTLAILLS